MKDHDHLPDELAGLKDASVYNHGFLPIAAAYCKKLKLAEVVDQMVSSKMELRPGLVVQAMVLDVLSGRSPLYRLENFLATQDTELLLGQKIDVHSFNDTNLARSLDAVFACGTSKIITEIGQRAASIFKLDLRTLSYDTTSTSVWGEYRQCEEEEPPPGPLITYGHSKDYQPQLKQFMTELLCVDRGVPIFGRTLDGNASDKTSNNQMLSRISSIMAKHGLGPGAFVYVADSAMVTQDNLKAIGTNRFISRLPATYNECKAAIIEAVNAKQWEYIGPVAEPSDTDARSHTQYKAYETSVKLYDTSYRAVVVHSDSHDKRKQKKLDRQIAASKSSISKQLKRIQKVYFCYADAEAAALKVEKLSDRLHKVSVSIDPVEVRQRGRPPKDRPVPTVTHYQLSYKLNERTEGIEREKEMAGCFVLLTNVPAQGKDALDSKGIVRTYKGQYIVESDFAFLKDPLVVNDLFLKTPSRIDALGMILIIALMVWRLMERSMRLYLEQTNSTVPGWDNKKTNKPTAFMMTTVFLGIQVILLKGQRWLLKGPTEQQQSFLETLGLDSSVFLDPKCLCTPIVT